MPPKYCETDATRLQCSLDILNGRLAQVKEAMKDQKKKAGCKIASDKTFDADSSDHFVSATWRS